MIALDREIGMLINELDPQRSGFIQYEEFLNYCLLSYIILKEIKLRNYFNSIDPHKTGVI